MTDDEFYSRTKAHWQLMHEALKDFVAGATYRTFDDLLGRLTPMLRGDGDDATRLAGLTAYRAEVVRLLDAIDAPLNSYTRRFQERVREILKDFDLFVRKLARDVDLAERIAEEEREQERHAGSQFGMGA